MQEDPVLNSPIRSLQLMLRTLSFLDSDYPRVIPDGIFGTATAGAVSTFQQKNGLPVTGIADLETHRAIVAAYDQALPHLTPAEAPHRLVPGGFVRLPGTEPPSCVPDPGTTGGLERPLPPAPRPRPHRTDRRENRGSPPAVQSLHGLSPTGKLDGETYHLAARLYRGSLERDRVPGCG